LIDIGIKARFQLTITTVFVCKYYVDTLKSFTVAIRSLIFVTCIKILTGVFDDKT